MAVLLKHCGQGLADLAVAAARIGPEDDSIVRKMFQQDADDCFPVLADPALPGINCGRAVDDAVK